MKAPVKADVPPGASPRSGVAPPAEHRFRKGQRRHVGAGRKAGATYAEWLNVMASLTEAELVAVADNARLPALKRHAARAILRGTGEDIDRILDRTIGKPRQSIDTTTTAAEPERVVPVELERLPLEFKREMLDLADRIEAWQRDHPEATE